MGRLLALSVALLVLLPCTVVADIIYVHPGGAGDYTTVPEGVANATVDDTVLVAAGTYTASGSGWPIVLHSASPTIMSEDGADATTIRGGTPFRTMPSDWECRVRIIGFTITQTPTPISRGAESGGTFHITDNVIDDNSDGLDVSIGNGLVARNLIRNNGARGIYTYHYWGIIEDNEICEHVRGIIGACCEEPIVRRNYIHHNTTTGAAPGFYLDITENLFEYNGTGVYGGMGGLIKDNIIRYNEIGVFLDAYGDIPVHCNDLHGNTAYNLKIGYGSGSLDATMNWWGTTDPDAIAATIWDCDDDPGIGCCVLFDPWCVTPGCEACPVEPLSWGGIKAMYR